MSVRTLLVLLLLFITTNGIAEPVALNPDHPDRYVVKKGDTLWDIAGRFLQDPWLWPEVWQVNPQVENPHLIYPGDVLSLTYTKEGKPQITVSRGRPTVKLSPEVRVEELEGAIPTIPLDAIHQFLTRPLVLSKEELESAAYVVATADEHLAVGSGDRVYVRGIEDDDHVRYSIFREGEVYRNPGEPEGEILGYAAVYAGDGRVQRYGDPATLVVTRSEREIQTGYRALPVTEEEFGQHFLPHIPGFEVDALILGVMDGVSQIGQHNVIVINKGEQDGMEVGHVLAVYRAGETIRDPVTEDPKDTVTLPDEHAGVVLVFRTFDRLSYALVMEASRPMHLYDKVRRPER